MRFLDNNFVTRCYYLSQGTFLIENKFNMKVVFKVEKSWQRLTGNINSAYLEETC